MASLRAYQTTLRLVRRAGIRDERSFLRRRYHSYEHGSTPLFSPAEATILASALNHVPAKGFSQEALICGVRDAGYRDASINLFPTRAFALVRYNLRIRRLALDADEGPAESPENITEKIRNLALRRLYGNLPIIHRWQEVLHPRTAYHRQC